MIQKAADEACYEAWPMLTLPWSGSRRTLFVAGISHSPWADSRLIHNDKGTQPL